MSLPTLDMAGWSILDFELAYAGLVAMERSGHAVTQQSRAAVSFCQFHPGADFIVDVVEEWINVRVCEMIDRLKTIRFDDPKDDDRRLQVLVRFNADYPGMTIPELVQMVLQQVVRPAA